jgi:hypothetical protein
LWRNSANYEPFKQLVPVARETLTNFENSFLISWFIKIVLFLNSRRLRTLSETEIRFLGQQLTSFQSSEKMLVAETSCLAQGHAQHNHYPPQKFCPYFEFAFVPR